LKSSVVGVNELFEVVASIATGALEAATQGPVLLAWATLALQDWDLPADHQLKDRKRREIMRALHKLYMKSLAESVNNADFDPLRAGTVEKVAEKGKEATAAESRAGEEGPIEDGIKE
jgi:hypothetical protein